MAWQKPGRPVSICCYSSQSISSALSRKTPRVFIMATLHTLLSRLCASRVMQFMFWAGMGVGVAAAQVIAPVAALSPEAALAARAQGQAIKAVYVLPDSRLLVVGEGVLAQDPQAVAVAVRTYVLAQPAVAGHDGVPSPRVAAQYKASGLGSAEALNALFAPAIARSLVQERATAVVQAAR
jgi:hypothetical protein